jgi:hypothetical protein
MTPWPDLLATALVGTDRRGEATDDAARALLDEAAAWTVYRRAGARPITGLPSPQPAPDEPLPLVGEAAAARLAILADPDPIVAGLDLTNRATLVAEWLREAISHGRRVPPELLPDLFETARRLPPLRSLIVTAAGARATWLAAQNPEWTFLVSTVDESVAVDPRTWTEGTLGQRLGYLVARRRTDPAAARDLLAEDWATLDSGERSQLLGSLSIELGPDDEAFLERALDDRRREVRVLAAQLLGALPHSGLNTRMTARAHSALSVRGDMIAITPPAECDPAMRRDGIEPRPPAGTGARAWWLQQVLARTRLDTLTDMAPDAWLRLSIEDDWLPVVCRGLAQAAREQEHPVWAAALLDRVDPRARPRDGDQALIEELYAVLPHDDLVRRASRALAQDQPGALRLVSRMLDEVPGPWPDELAAVAVAAFEVHARDNRGPFDLHHAIRVAGLRMPPACAAAVAALAERLGGANPDDRRVHLVERLADMLQFRHEMIQEIA